MNANLARRRKHDDSPPVLCKVGLVGTAEARGKGMDRAEELELRERLAHLRAAHRELDSRIAALEATSPFDQVSISRLKKRKLMVKDQLTALEDRLFPDIIA